MKRSWLILSFCFLLVMQIHAETAIPVATLIVNAGPDQTITLPQDELVLFGSVTDTVGRIKTSSWKQVSGRPLTMTPGPAGSYMLTLTNLLPGKYQFALRATNNLGASASDMVMITVLPAFDPFLEGNFQMKSARVVGSCISINSLGVVGLKKCNSSDNSQILQYDPLSGRLNTLDGRCLVAIGRSLLARTCSSNSAFWSYDNSGQWWINYGTSFEQLKCIEPLAFASETTVGWVTCVNKKTEQIWGISQIAEPINNSDIIKSLRQFVVSGDFRAINAINPPAIPIAVDAAGIPLITVSTLGKGRVAAVGKLQFLETLASSDTTYQQLMKQLIQWLGKKEQPRIALGLYNSNLYLPGLTSLGFTSLGRRDFNQLGDVDVYVMYSQTCETFSEVDLAKLRNFVKAGGAILAGRFNIHYGNPDFFPANECITWKLLAEAGIGMSVNNAEPSTVGASVPLTATVDPKFYNMANAVEALARHQLGLEILSSADLEALRKSTFWGMITKTIIDGRSSFALATKALRAALGPLQISLNNCYFTGQDWIKDVGLYAEYALTQSLKSDQQIVHSTVGTYPGPIGQYIIPESLSFTTNLDMPAGTPSINRGVAWISTGLYALPGEKITVTAPLSLANTGIRIRIGHQVDDVLFQALYLRPKQFCRFPLMSTAAKMTMDMNTNSAMAQLSNAFGGLIYVQVPFGLTLGDITFQFSGVTQAPTFILGLTSNADWEQQVQIYQVPFGEWISDEVIISADVEDLNAAQNVEVSFQALHDMQFAERYMAGIRPDAPIFELERVARRVSLHPQQLWGAHNGYPLYMTSAWTKELATLNTATNAFGLWGYLHESGHNWDKDQMIYSGNWIEIIPNVFAIYAFKTVMTDHFGISYSMAWGNRLFPDKRLSARNRYLNDPTIPFTSISYEAGLDMYLVLMEKFGWDTFAEVYRTIRNSGTIPSDRNPANDRLKADTLVTLYSNLVGVNVAPYFLRYRFPLSDSVVQALANSGMPSWDGTTP